MANDPLNLDETVEWVGLRWLPSEQQRQIPQSWVVFQKPGEWIAAPEPNF